MQEGDSQVPLEIQLQAICLPVQSKAYNLLISFLPELKAWDYKHHESLELYKKRVRQHLNFTPMDLIRYLESHPETCEALLNNSYDKRYAPSTFIDQGKDNKYRVGWVDPRTRPVITQVRVFSTFAEAAADYVLFSWGFPRLSREQANWFEANWSEMENH